MIELGRPLSEAELSSYDVLPLPLAKRVRVLSVPRLPGGYDGMTLGRFIILARQIDDTGNSSLLAHELVHVRQWADLGLLNFSSSYVLSFLGGLRTHRRWGPRLSFGRCRDRGQSRGNRLASPQHSEATRQLHR